MPGCLVVGVGLWGPGLAPNVYGPTGVSFRSVMALVLGLASGARSAAPTVVSYVTPLFCGRDKPQSTLINLTYRRKFSTRASNGKAKIGLE